MYGGLLINCKTLGVGLDMSRLHPGRCQPPTLSALEDDAATAAQSTGESGILLY